MKSQHYFKLIVLVLALSLSNAFIKYTSGDDISGLILKNYENSPVKTLFKVYHFVFNKSYDLNSEEGLQRYLTFKESVKKIKEVNAQNYSYWLGINQFSDMSREEFRKNYLNNNIEKNIRDRKGLRVTMPEPLDFKAVKCDWKDKYDKVQNQGSCGSCWAFATIAAIEGNYERKYPESKFPKFSTQALVSCDTGNYGCNGGWPTVALEWLEKNGLPYESDYPYVSGETGQNEVCKFNELPQEKKNKIVEGFIESTENSRDSFLENLSNGPLIIVVDAEGNGNFQSYKGGIMDETMTCRNINHAVVMVGYTPDETNGRPYYIALNSWGKGWGENGYFRIYQRDSDQTCFMEKFGIRPLINKSPNPVPPPPPAKCAQIFQDCDYKSSKEKEPIEICENSPTFGQGALSEQGIKMGKFSEITLFNGEKCYGSYVTLNSDIKCFSTQVSWLVNWAKSAYISRQTPPEKCIWLYAEGCHSQLKHEHCGSSIFDLSSIGWADQIGSVAIGSGIAKIQLYTKKNLCGSSSTHTSSAFGLHPNLYKKVNSIRITPK